MDRKKDDGQEEDAQVLFNSRVKEVKSSPRPQGSQIEKRCRARKSSSLDQGDRSLALPTCPALEPE